MGFSINLDVKSSKITEVEKREKKGKIVEAHSVNEFLYANFLLFRWKFTSRNVNRFGF